MSHLAPLKAIAGRLLSLYSYIYFLTCLVARHSKDGRMELGEREGIAMQRTIVEYQLRSHVIIVVDVNKT